MIMQKYQMGWPVQKVYWPYILAYWALRENNAAQKKFSVKDFFSKCEQTRRKLRICSHY